MECHGVELDAVREENHRSKDTVGETSSLSCSSLTFIFEKVWQTLEAHDLSSEEAIECVMFVSWGRNKSYSYSLQDMNSPECLQRQQMPPSN